MVRRSVLVYDLLKSEKRNDGFSPTEIFKRVSEIHNIAPGKGLKKQVNVALRRGMDFGIVVKKNKKFLYDSDSNILLNQPMERKAKKKKARKKAPKKSKKPQTRLKSRRKRSPSSSRKQSHIPPRPRVPPPPDWTPKRRNIREEPIPKFIKHRSHSPRLL